MRKEVAEEMKIKEDKGGCNTVKEEKKQVD
jgi:hypothetical protein